MKPVEYSESCIITEDTAYRVEALKGTHSDIGTLHLGRVVWTKKHPKDQALDERISVYAEGVGLVFLDPRSLRPSS